MLIRVRSKRVLRFVGFKEPPPYVIGATRLWLRWLRQGLEREIAKFRKSAN